MADRTPSTLVLIPSPLRKGGIASIYRKVKFPQSEISTEVMVDQYYSLIAQIRRLLRLYGQFRKKELVLTNVSLRAKSLIREGLTLLFVRAVSSGRVLVFWHGWDNELYSRVRGNKLKAWLLKKIYSSKSVYHITLGAVFEKKLKELSFNNVQFKSYSLAEVPYLDQGEYNNKIEGFNFPKNIHLAFIGTVIKSKGIEIAIHTSIALSQKFPQYRFKLKIAGEGADKAELMQKYAHIGQLDWLGFINEEQKAEMLSSSHFFLFPTYYGEGLPCVILEAMLYGLPIITRNDGAISEVIQDQIHGFISSEKTSDIFVSAIAQLILNPENYGEISKRNYEFANSEFTVDAFRENLLSIFYKTSCS